MRGWQVVALWVVGVLASGLLLRTNLKVFSATAQNGTGGLRSIGTPMWLPPVLFAIFMVLLLSTLSWWRGRSHL